MGVSDTARLDEYFDHTSTITRFLQKIGPELDALPSFNAHIGKISALNLGMCMDLEYKLLTLLNDEAALATLSTGEKERLLGRVTIAKGVAYDKLRLQEGKSTSNSAHQLQVEHAHKALFVAPVSSGEVRTSECEDNETEGKAKDINGA